MWVKLIFFTHCRFDHCSDLDPENPPKFQYQLILRKWINMNPSMEFRCFIGNQTLLAICQRDVRTFYEYIGCEKSQIIQDIQDFFDENIRGKFPLDNCNVLCSFSISPIYSLFHCH